jgi:hypothetical protein
MFYSFNERDFPHHNSVYQALGLAQSNIERVQVAWLRSIETSPHPAPKIKMQGVIPPLPVIIHVLLNLAKEIFILVYQRVQLKLN